MFLIMTLVVVFNLYHSPGEKERRTNRWGHRRGRIK